VDSVSTVIDEDCMGVEAKEALPQGVPACRGIPSRIDA
jgi:hypothetical protein